jgi:hypothetical protein
MLLPGISTSHHCAAIGYVLSKGELQHNPIVFMATEVHTLRWGGSNNYRKWGKSK